MSTWAIFAVLGEELPVGEVGAEHEQRVAGMHRRVAGGKADEAGHPDVVGIVVLDVLLAAEGMDDRRLERIGELHQGHMRAGAATAAEQRDLPARVEELRQLVQFGCGGAYVRRRRQQARLGGDGAGGRVAQRHVAGDHDDRDAALADGGADRGLEHVGQLGRARDHLAIDAAFAEKVLRMRLLEIVRADLGRRDVGCDRQNGGPRPVAVEQAVDEDADCRGRKSRRRPRAGRSAGPRRRRRRRATSSWRTCTQSITPRRRIASVMPFRLSPTRPKNALHADLLQGLDDEIGDIGDLHGAVPPAIRSYR